MGLLETLHKTGNQYISCVVKFEYLVNEKLKKKEHS